MLITTAQSQAKKTYGCAITYRASNGNPFGTCPSDCPLMTAGNDGTRKVDQVYLRTLLSAVPFGGVAFTYTHFHPVQWEKPYDRHRLGRKPTTVVNYSADHPADIKTITDSYRVPVVVAVTLEQAESWGGDDWRVAWYGAQRIVRCPAEWNPRVSCSNCGGTGAAPSNLPLCARQHRQYAIGFTAHGTRKGLVGSEAPGGCYAASGNTAIHWNRLAAASQPESDSERLRAFVEQLPRGTVLRHHVAGDIGRE